MRNPTAKALALSAGIFLAAVLSSASADAGSLHQGSNGSGGAVTGSKPGQVIWTYYETTEPFTECLSTFALADGLNASETRPLTDGILIDPDGCNHGGNGDNIIRLINPNGAANGNLAGAKTQTVCAMIYVFDDDEEMGECCGCSLSSAQLATFSVEHNLTSNWGLSGGSEEGDHGNGAIAIVAAGQNAPASSPGLSNGQGCAITQSGACNNGCDPTNIPGYSVTSTSNLLGSITHSQETDPSTPLTAILLQTSVTEVDLSDDSGGDPSNLNYLQSQCGALVGNGTQGGICNCPIE